MPTNVDPIQQLIASPIHGLKSLGIFEVDIELLDTDPTNPGSDPFSSRYKRREKPISESFDILGSIVYPVVISSKDDGTGRFWIVDGHGRSDEMRRRQVKKVRALVYPSLTLEQRILLRQVLNAAQEPFDTPLVLKDLHVLANERGLDIRKDADLHALLADLPSNIRKHEEKLKLLAKWPEAVSDKIGIDDNDEAEVLGLDKVKELDGLVNAVKKHHPKSASTYAGATLYRQVLKLYFGGKFRDGARSQDGIREARARLKKIEPDHPLVTKLLSGGVTSSEFRDAYDAERGSEHNTSEDIVDLCKRLNALLTDVDAHNLSAVERRTLRRTCDLITKVLEEVSA
jgi:ParB-like chromosome segregation protein Spo0J